MISNTKNKLSIFFLTLLLPIGALLSITFFNQAAYAVEPGCYGETAEGDYFLLGIGDCPSEGAARAVSQFDACFVGSEERDCDDLSAPGSAVPRSQPNDEGGTTTTSDNRVEFAVEEGEHQCGTGGNAVKTSINLGCKGAEIEAEGGEINPVIDMLFALFRFAAAGVGLVVIGSIIYAGVQYTASRGNPQMTEAAIKRIASSVGALLLYIFLFAIANFLVPGGILI